MDILNEIKYFMFKFFNINKYKKFIYVRDCKFIFIVFKGCMLEFFFSLSFMFFLV